MKMLRQKEIAKQLGVSASTVSLVLKDPNTTRASPETRNQIFELIRAHRYPPSTGNRSGDIACVMPKTSSEKFEAFFYSSLLMAAEQAGQQFGYTVQLHSYTDINSLKPLIHDPRIVGIISINASLLAEEFGISKPIVAMNSVYTANCDVIKSHHRGSSRDQVDLLIRHGHQRIGYFVTESPNIETSSAKEQNEAAAERFAGYCEGLYQHQIPTNSDYCHREILPEYTEELEEPALRALNHFFGLPQPPTAIIAFNDLHAIYLLKAAHKLGLQVPRDLSIVGNDNMEMGRYSTPTLTTAEQNRDALGQVAVERLIQRIENHTQTPPQIVLIPLKLIERESTGPAPHP